MDLCLLFDAPPYPGEEFLQRVVIFGDMDLLSLQQYPLSATEYAVKLD